MRFYKFIQNFIIICCGLLALGISVNSIIITITYDYNEANLLWDVRQSSIVILGTVVIFATLLGSSKLYSWSSAISAKRLLQVTFYTTLFIGVLWVIISDSLQQWDQGDILSLARIGTQFDFRNIGGYDHAGYMERFPYQAPFVCLIRLLVLFSNTKADYIYSLLNALFVAITAVSLVAAVIEIDKENKFAAFVASILSVTLLPSYFFITFLYPNTLGIMLVSVSFYYFIKSNQAMSAREKCKYGIYSAIAVGAAVAFKSSLLIALVAFVMTQLLFLVRHKEKLGIVFILLSILTNVAIVDGSKSWLSDLSGTNLNNGVPKVVWLAMGIGSNQSKDLPIVPPFPGGMFDGLPWKLTPGEYSPDNLKKLSYELMAERLNKFKNEPGQAALFFLKKTSYEWGDPLYGSLLSSNWTRGNVFSLTHQKVLEISQGDRVITPIAKSVYYGSVNFLVKWLSDIMQSVLYISFLIGIVYVYNEKTKGTWLYFAPIILFFLGGGILYIFWESKSQYIFGYVCLFIPVASYGVALLKEEKFCSRMHLS